MVLGRARQLKSNPSHVLRNALEQAGVRAAKLGEEGRDLRILVAVDGGTVSALSPVYAIEHESAPRAREVVREPSTGEADSDLGVNADGATDGSDEWARGYSHTRQFSRNNARVLGSEFTREVGLEALDVLAVVGQAVTSTDTVIAAAEQDTAATSAELREQVAHGGRVVEGNGLLVIAVTGGELRQQGSDIGIVI